jgi:hypothetical protein
MKTAIEDVSYELIKAHILQPEQSSLAAEHQEILDRIVSVAKVLDKNPIQKQAMAIHMVKFPNIGKTQAFNDIRMAMRLFNSIYTFDYDFWQTWLMNDIVRNIDRCRINNSPAALRVIAAEHANLLNALGKRPEEIEDPRRMEKNNFYIVVQSNNNTVNIDADQLSKLPANTVSEINRVLFSGAEITDVEAEEIMGT